MASLSICANILRRCSRYHQRPSLKRWPAISLFNLSFTTTSSYYAPSPSSVPKRNHNDETAFHPKKRIIVAMSGGVDSSVAAHLLQQNHSPQCEIIGLFMTNWDTSDETSDKKCLQSEKDSQDVTDVCHHLSIPHRNVNFTSDYWVNVFEPFVQALTDVELGGNGNGEKKKTWMPNPDVACNSMVKFGVMKDYAKDVLKGDYIATGHYARLWRRRGNLKNGEGDDVVEEYDGAQEDLEKEIMQDLKGTDAEEWIYSWGSPSSPTTTTTTTTLPPLLVAGADLSKDQSYFLSGVSALAFHDVLFPLGHLIKTTPKNKNDTLLLSETNDCKSVRDIAIEANLPNANKRESMGICFIGKRNFSDFMSDYMPKSNPPPPSAEEGGKFVDVDTGEIVGSIDDNAKNKIYTIGQGAKISGASRKWFVVGRTSDYEIGSTATATLSSSSIFVCGDTHHPALYSDELYVREEDFNWIGGGCASGDSTRSEPPPPLARGESMTALCRTRHLQPLFGCDVVWDPSNARYIIKFHKAIRAVTPGQMVVIYMGKKGLICLGGGPIWDRGPSYHERGLELPVDIHPSGGNDLSLARRNTTKSK